jgi:hypothetical protein
MYVGTHILLWDLEERTLTTAFTFTRPQAMRVGQSISRGKGFAFTTFLHKAGRQTYFQLLTFLIIIALWYYIIALPAFSFTGHRMYVCTYLECTDERLDNENKTWDREPSSHKSVVSISRWKGFIQDSSFSSGEENQSFSKLSLLRISIVWNLLFRSQTQQAM